MLNKFLRMHYRKRMKVIESIDLCVAAAFRGMGPEEPLDRYRVQFVRASSSEPDYDGLVGSFKVVMDSIRKLRVIKDDKLSNSGNWEVSWQKEKPRAGWIAITISEL